MKVYATEYPTPLSPTIWQRFRNRLPAGIMSKIECYRRWQDACGSLFGKVLLERGLLEFGYSGSLENLRFSTHGRPYFSAGPEFSISHSGTRTICVISDYGRVGIDLEEIRDCNVDDFKNQFTIREWQTIQQSPVSGALLFHYWTAKESVVKADGRGLSVPLSGLEVMNRTVRLDNTIWNLYSVVSFPGYACHLAYEETECEVKIQEFTPVELLEVDRI